MLRRGPPHFISDSTSRITRQPTPAAHRRGRREDRQSVVASVGARARMEALGDGSKNGGDVNGTFACDTWRD